MHVAVGTKCRHFRDWTWHSGLSGAVALGICADSAGSCVTLGAAGLGRVLRHQGRPSRALPCTF